RDPQSTNKENLRVSEVHRTQITKICAQARSIAHKQRKFARKRGPPHTNNENLRASEVHRTQTAKICAQARSTAHKRRKFAHKRIPPPRTTRRNKPPESFYQRSNFLPPIHLK